MLCKFQDKRKSFTTIVVKLKEEIKIELKDFDLLLEHVSE